MSAEVRCPLCGEITFFARYKPCCRQCGWNRENAERELSRSLREYVLGYLRFLPFILLFLAVFWWTGSSWRVMAGMAAFYLIFLAVAMLSDYLQAAQDLRKLAAEMPYVPRPVPQPLPTSQARAEALNQAAKVPPPGARIVRHKSSAPFGASILGLTFLSVLACIFIAFILYFFSRPNRFSWEGPGAVWPLTLGMIGGLLFAVLEVRSRRQERKLLSKGSVAVASIVRQRTTVSKRGRTHRVWFEFRDASGRTVKGKAQDLTQSLYEGMSVLVFHDPTRPEKHVAVCASYYEILPSKKIGGNN